MIEPELEVIVDSVRGVANNKIIHPLTVLVLSLVKRMRRELRSSEEEWAGKECYSYNYHTRSFEGPGGLEQRGETKQTQ